MKTLLATVLALGLMVTVAHAEETVGESAKATGNTMARKMKKGGHKMKEAMCMEGDVKCAAEKGKHRVQEAGEAVGDKAKEVGNKVD